jgi:hypothetical protein
MHNESANFHIGARNFVKTRQGYQTVKTAAIRHRAKPEV